MGDNDQTGSTATGSHPAPSGRRYNPAAKFKSGYVEPRELGCRCDLCPLREWHAKMGSWRPVPFEEHTGDHATVLGHFPGEMEVYHRRPLVGKAWERVLSPIFDDLGISRAEVSVGNVLMCQPPLNDMQRLLGDVARANRKIKRENEKRKAKGLSELPPKPTPHQCCRPGVVKKATQYKHILTLGPDAYHTLTGERSSIYKTRGALIDRVLKPDRTFARLQEGVDPQQYAQQVGGKHLRIVPTLQPASVLYGPEWAWVVHRDVQRWWRWMHGKLDWKPVQVITHPTPAQVEAFLFDAERAKSIDVETTVAKGAEERNRLRTIGFGTPDRAMIIPIQSVRGDRFFSQGWIDAPKQPWVQPPYYDDHAAAQILRLVMRFLQDKQYVKIVHNGYFDWGIFDFYFPGITVEPVFDTILGIRACASEIKRDLYTMGTLLTDVPDWKAANDERNIAVNPKSDMELWKYNGIDCGVTSRSYPKVFEWAQQRGQMKALALDHQVQPICRGMHRMGMLVDQEKRADLEGKVEKRALEHKEAFYDYAKVKISITSTQDIAWMLYDEWKLPVPALTDSGDPSTDDKSLAKLIYDGLCDNEDQIEAIRSLRKYRKEVKRLSTILRPLRPWNSYRKGGDITEDECAGTGGLAAPDGRVYPNYNTHTPATGRISSSRPNAQNFEKTLRQIIVPAPGRLFVGADYDQLELRLIAALAGVDSYLEVFRNGGDPHAVTASLVYGETFRKAFINCLSPKEKARFKRDGIMRKPQELVPQDPLYNALRQFAKTFVYLMIYGGSSETAYQNLRMAEGRNGKRMFPDMTYAEVDSARRKWLGGAPQIGEFWKRLLLEAKTTGLIREPIGERARDAQSGDVNVIYNHPIQGGGAAIVAKGMIRAVRAYPFRFDQRLGLVNQCHDAVTFEVMEDEAHDFRKKLEETLTDDESHPAVSFSVEARVAESWKDAA